jgi:hypothetical protein
VELAERPHATSSGVLRSVRADVIRQYHKRGDEGTVQVLTEQEADDLLRFQAIEELKDTIRP